MTLQVYLADQALTSDLVLQRVGAVRTTDWYGRELASPFSWVVALDPQSFWFSCAIPGGKNWSAAHTSGQFVEGLWEEDVAEVFIRERDGRYQELNFNPSGAWWSMTHSSYRLRDPNTSPPLIRTIDTGIGEGWWRVVVSFDRASFQVPIAPTSFLHISGISYGSEVSFISSRAPAGMAPDFHHERCFEPVTFLA